MNAETMTRGAAKGGHDLHRVIALNEELKAVLQVSREVELEAINAMLAARRAGDAVRGFGVVSSELRNFSGRLSGFMTDLSADISMLVHGVADLTRSRNMRRHLANAHQSCGGCAGLLPALAQMDQALARAADANTRGWLRVRKGIRHSVRLCDAGRALSRSARIEAVYGGAMRDELVQAGMAMEATIERIRGRLLAGQATAEEAA